METRETLGQLREDFLRLVTPERVIEIDVMNQDIFYAMSRTLRQKPELRFGDLGDSRFECSVGVRNRMEVQALADHNLLLRSSCLEDSYRGLPIVVVE